MLSDKEIVCPNNLLNVAHRKKGVVAGIVNAGKPLPMLSVMDAVKEDLIIPIFIGDKEEIQKSADIPEPTKLEKPKNPISLIPRIFLKIPI